nr:MAG TPA: hypothetical protein [Caudoviricetes sp.]DAX07248.1 MAG TPA: hypothetical protein [Bacteriophage sp.]
MLKRINFIKKQFSHTILLLVILEGSEKNSR